MIHDFLVESNWVFDFCAPRHRKDRDVGELLDQARSGSVRIHIPSGCLKEGADAVRKKCQPRLSNLQEFRLMALADGVLSQELNAAVVQFFELSLSCLPRTLMTRQAKPEIAGAAPLRPRQYFDTAQAEMMIGGPNALDLALLQMHEAGRIRVRQLRSPEAVKHFHHGCVMILSGIENAKAFETVDQVAEGSGLLLAHPVEEPSVGL